MRISAKRVKDRYTVEPGTIAAATATATAMGHVPVISNIITGSVIAVSATATATGPVPVVLAQRNVTTVSVTATATAMGRVPTVAGGSGGAITHGRQVNATNTGIAGIGVTVGSLINTGATTYSTNGQVITGRNFTGTVNLTGNNITLRGCRVNLPGAGNWKGVNVTGTDCIIEDCTIIPSSGSIYMAIHANNSSGLIVRRCDVSLGENIMTIEGANTTVEDSYFHEVSNESTPGGHRDIIEVYAGNNCIIRRNKLLMDAYETTPVNIMPWSGSTSVANVLVEDNYIDGGNMHVLTGVQSTGTLTYVKVLRNDMGGHTGATWNLIYWALNNADSEPIVNTPAQQTANPQAILWPTTGADVNYWVDCADLSPNRTGQVIVP